MKKQYQDLLEQAYDAFNARDIDTVLSLMNEDVHWPKGWEGGYVKGYDEVRDYWTRQWKEIDPEVKPVYFTELQDEQVDVEVHQIAKDLTGQVLFDGIVHHVYTFEKGKVKSMEIKKPETEPDKAAK